ncbi:MAG: PilZ domain-containing protein [Amphiplicatus sp.]
MKTAVHPLPEVDRRREPRTPARIDCVFTVNGGRKQAGLTRDVSPSGVAILSRTLVEPGDLVSVSFDKFGRHLGKVVRLFDGGFAIELKRASLALVPLSSPSDEPPLRY